MGSEAHAAELLVPFIGLIKCCAIPCAARFETAIGRDIARAITKIPALGAALFEILETIARDTGLLHSGEDVDLHLGKRRVVGGDLHISAVVSGLGGSKRDCERSVLIFIERHRQTLDSQFRAAFLKADLKRGVAAVAECIVAFEHAGTRVGRAEADFRIPGEYGDFAA